MTTSVFNPSIVQLGLLGLALLAGIIQLIYYLFFYIQPLRKIREVKAGQVHHITDLPGVSVIVYANNDSEQLQKNLKHILEQDYPSFEVVVVNDGSTDETEQVLSGYESTYNNLYHTFLTDEARNLSRRKLSLTLGIKAARHDIVLFTNANCAPESNQWIKSMARNFSDKTAIVLGCTRLERKTGKGERFFAFDLLLRSVRLFGYTLACKPYSAEGTNLGYRKSLFFENKGYAKFMHLHPGDADLFVNQVATRFNTKVELAPEAMMTAYFDRNREGWLQIKRESAFTSRFIHSGAKVTFGFETLSRYLFWGASIGTICFWKSGQNYAIAAIVLLFLHFILGGIYWYQAGKSFNTRRFFFCVPFFELIIPLSNLIIKIDTHIKSKQYYTWHL